MRWKSVIIKTAAAAAAAGILAGGGALTMSYLTSRESITNTFTVGDLDIGLKEPDWDPDDGDGKNIYPGYSVYKNPTVKNITSSKNGEEPCYVRMRIQLLDGETKITDTRRLDLIKTMIRFDSTYTGNYESPGSAQTLQQGRVPGYSLEEMEKLPMINPLFVVDRERSSENEIVCNYMGQNRRGILNIGEQATLFTTLAMPTQWTNEEVALVGDFRIAVKAEAIQASGFSGQEAALAALDKELLAAVNKVSAADGARAEGMSL